MIRFARYFLIHIALMLAWLSPLGNRAFAQDGPTYSRVIGFDRESGDAYIRAGGDARFSRFSEMTRGLLGGEEIVREDIVQANLGRIIFVCRGPDGERALSRRADSHDRCPPRARSHWLVRGATYRVPVRLSDADASRPEVARLRDESRQLREANQTLRGELETLRDASSGKELQEKSWIRADGWSLDWVSALIGLLFGMGVVFLYLAWNRRALQRLWVKAYEALEKRLLKERADAVKRVTAKYEGHIKERYNRIEEFHEENAKLRETIRKHKEELDETRALLRERSGLKGQEPSVIVAFGSDDANQDSHESRNRTATDVPPDETLISKSSNTVSVEKHAAVQAQALSLQGEIERRDAMKKRIPELMNELETLKPSTYDLLCSRLSLVADMREAALKEGRSKREVAITFDALIRGYRSDLDRFLNSSEGSRYEAAKAELVGLLFEATGVNTDTAVAETWILRARKELNELFVQTHAERHVRKDLEQRLRSLIAELERSSDRSDEPTVRTVTSRNNGHATEASLEAERILALETQMAALTGTVRGQEARLAELEQGLREQTDAHEAALAELRARVEAFDRERSALHMELGEAKSIADASVALLKQKRIPRDNPWAGKLKDIRASQKPKRSPNVLSRDKTDVFFHALAKFLDELEPGRTNVIEVDERAVIDLTHLAHETQIRLTGETGIEGVMRPGSQFPLRSLPYQVVLGLGGAVPERTRKRTIAPPPGGGSIH